MSFKIQLADWRDREQIEDLRRESDFLVEGGLYEMLHWPTSHVHIARLDGRVVGYAAINLIGGTAAEDAGAVVAADVRRNGVAKALRATQMRDLVLLGVDVLYSAQRLSNAPACTFATAVFGQPVDGADLPGFGQIVDFESRVTDVFSRLGTMGAARPYPLSSVNQTKLLAKRERAEDHLRRMTDMAQFGLWKATTRGRRG